MGMHIGPGAGLTFHWRGGGLQLTENFSEQNSRGIKKIFRKNKFISRDKTYFSSYFFFACFFVALINFFQNRSKVFLFRRPLIQTYGSERWSPVWERKGERQKPPNTLHHIVNFIFPVGSTVLINSQNSSSAYHIYLSRHWIIATYNPTHDTSN